MWKQRPLLLLVVVIVFMLICSVVHGKVFSKHFEDVDLDVEAEFVDYIVQFNKSYRFNVDEYKKRFVAFQKSLAMINSMNTLRKHKHSARFGLTEYSDMSDGEFVTAKLNADLKSLTTNGQRNSIIKEQTDRRNRQISINLIRYNRDTVDGVYSLPNRIDWRERGVVSEIRNQGLCGACWAHSVIGTVESMIAIAKNASAFELSVQQMIDCATNNNHGCNGGDTCKLLDWLVKNNVIIQPMAAYPMNSIDTECKMGDTKNMSQIIQIENFTCDSFVGREQKILHILANYGPVVTAVNGLLWQNYLGGIIQFHCDGSVANLNHAVQIVGYDRTGDVPYYIIRNSWGKKFGDNGYLKLQIGGNTCGVANQVSRVNVGPPK